MEEIVERTASAMEAEGSPFQGVLFAGLMIKDGEVRLCTSAVHLGESLLGNYCQGKQWSQEAQACLLSKHASTSSWMYATPNNVLEQ